MSYKFITSGPNGEREWRSVKEAFDNKGPKDEVYVEVAATGARARVLKP